MEAMLDAVLNNDFKMVESLILKGENIDRQRADGKTALMLAVTAESCDTFKLLLSYGANMDAVDANGETALQMAFKSKETPAEIFKEILIVARRQHPDTKVLVRKLFQAGCSLVHAVYLEDYEVIKGLLDLGVDVNSTGYQGETALQATAVRDQLQLAGALVSAGANVNALDDYDHGALFYAAAHGDSAVVSWLLDHGANPNTKTFKSGLTPLIEAVENPSENDEEDRDFAKCVELLIRYGAVLSQKTGDNLTVFDEALRNGNYRRINMLICHLALREMQGDTMAKAMIECKLDENKHALSKLLEYFEKCRRRLTSKIYENVTFFDLLTSSERKIRSYIRKQQIREKVFKLLVNKSAQFCKENNLYGILLEKRMEKVPSRKLENAAILALGKLFDKTYNESYVFAREVIEYLNIDSLHNLSQI